MGSVLQDLPDDVVIHLFDLLDVPELLTLRQTCRRMRGISELRIVWTNACNHQILLPHYPFPDMALDALAVPDLESLVRHAYLLASRWLSSKPPYCGIYSDFDATNGTPVSDLRFVPGHAGNWLLATMPMVKTELSAPEWVLNTDSASDAVLAVSVMQEGHTHVEIMSLHKDVGLRSLGTIDSPLNPVYFHRDVLVLCDPIDVSVVTNWKTGASAILRRPQDASQTAISINDRCIQVVFAAACILVVRGRSLTLFPNPTLTMDPPAVHAPLAVHSFGWVDGVAVTTSSVQQLIPFWHHLPQPLSILIRPEPDDPWAADDAYNLDLYVLHAEPTFPLSTLRPYIFPPRPAPRPHGTALWIEPQDRSATGLLHDAQVPVARQNERLVCAAFPGPLFRGDSDKAAHGDLDVGPVPVRGRTLRTNELNNWKALDYDEHHKSSEQVPGRVLLL
ncbi:hypothetical protein B0H13DRAFT_2662358 [Mycena leptocephala]|nr:hypothetical protein B0H13DRAFT_2662358 [Mycena leptocephala]